jgi:hypothetical protein
MKFGSYLAAVLFPAVFAANEDWSSCIVQSTGLSGVRTGTEVSDLPTLLSNFESGAFKADFEAGAIKFCTNSNSASSFFGKLLG